MSQYFSLPHIRRSLNYFLLGKALSIVTTLAFSVILVRELDIARYAAYTAWSGLLPLMYMFASVGISRLIHRYFPQLLDRKAGQHLARLFVVWMLIRIGLSVFLGLLMLFFYDVIAQWAGFKDPLGWLLASNLLAFGFMHYMTRVLEAFLFQGVIAWSLLLLWSLKLLGLIAAVAMTDELVLANVLGVQLLAYSITSLFLALALVHPIRRCLQDTGINPFTRKDMMRLASMNYVQDLSGFHTTAGARKMVAVSFFPTELAAALGFAQTLTGAAIRFLPTNLFIGMIEPLLILKSKSHDRYQSIAEIINGLTKLNGFLLMPLICWSLVGMDDMVNWISQGKYGDQSWLMLGLLIVVWIEGHYRLLMILANAANVSEWLVYSQFLSWLLVPLIVLGLWYFPVPSFMLGIVGISVIRVGCLSYGLMQQNVVGFLQWRGWGKMMLASVLSTGGGHFSSAWMVHDFQWLVSGVLCFSLYLWLSAHLKPFSLQDKQLYNRLLGRQWFVW